MIGSRSVIVIAALVVAGGASSAPDPHSAAEMAARTGGAAPISQAAYAALPKVRKHRAWLPASVDLTSRFPTPGDQEWQGSCTAWATGYAARSFLHSADLGRAPQKADELISPEYIYNKIRPGDPKQCNAPGALPDALNLLTAEALSASGAGGRSTMRRRTIGARRSIWTT